MNIALQLTHYVMHIHVKVKIQSESRIPFLLKLISFFFSKAMQTYSSYQQHVLSKCTGWFCTQHWNFENMFFPTLKKLGLHPNWNFSRKKKAMWKVSSLLLSLASYRAEAFVLNWLTHNHPSVSVKTTGFNVGLDIIKWKENEEVGTICFEISKI